MEEVVIAIGSCSVPQASELFHEYGEGFAQLEPVAGGVCEEESALRNTASILNSSSASLAFS